VNKWWLFWILSVGLLTGPAVTTVSYGLPSAGNNDSIDQDAKKDKVDKVKEKVKEKKEEAKEKAAEAKKKWQKKGSEDGGGSDNSDSGSDSSGSEGSSDSGDDSSGEGSDDSGSSEGSDDGSAQDDGSEESGDEDDTGSEEESSGEEAGEETGEESEQVEEETTEEEVVEEEVVEEQVVEEYVEEEPVEYPEGTHPDEYFIDRPMEKLQLQKYHITDLDNNKLMSLKEGKEVEINYSLRNVQQREQTYVMIAQIIDQHGVTIDMGWYVDTIQTGEYADWYGFWTPDAPGMCVIKIMVWDGIGENPAPLSDITEMTVLVQPA
jgi:hypothetical protein